MRTLFLSLSFILALSATYGQAVTHDIKIKVNGYAGEYVTIANNLLDKQYVVDTLYKSDDGYFHLSDTNELKKGIYLVVLSPNNNYFQFLVGNEKPFFSLETTAKEIGKVKTKGSKENQEFYDYLGFLEQQRVKDLPLKEAVEKEGVTEAEKEKISARRQAINAEVEVYQQKVITEKPESFVAAIISANLPVTPPDFKEASDEERPTKQWRYVQDHYFDHLDLQDERLLRTPFLFTKIDYYVHRLHVQHPDSIAQAMDKVLKQMDENGDLFKTYLISFLNEAAKSEIVGMDAIYVFLIDNYYATGKAPWTDDEQLQKFIDNADRLRPLLIGKTAPDLKLEKRDGTSINLYDVETDYTVLYFWRYDCGHCKKSTPAMKEFYEKWKDNGVTLFAICAKTGKDVAPCWEYIDENEINDWLHTVDPYMRSRYAKLYDVQTTPAIFVLDKDKKIISKRIGAEQLDELLTRIIEQQQAREAEENKSDR